MKIAAIAAAIVAVAASASAALIPVDNLVEQALAEGRNLDVFLQFPYSKHANKNVLKSLPRPQRRTYVHDLLSSHAKVAQAETVAFLRARGFNVRTYWINNSLLVHNATPALINELRRARSSVLEIVADKAEFHIETPVVHEVYETEDRRAEWGIEIIEAPAAWNITRGAGVTIANVDTGVRFTHESLIGSYRGNLGGGSYDHDYNWFDPSGSVTPFDNNGHGTHTMGTIIGSDSVSGIGVAPDAKWIAAKGCASSSCSNAHLLASLEYVLCPSRQDGTEPDCERGADVVSNSWGGGSGSSTYLDVIERIREAGIIPIFSQGNSGPTCGSANSPGDLYNVIGVGSTDSADALSGFSSRGPADGTATHPLQKPDISAPGSNVRSSYYTSDTTYASLSGTSMAAPHVAGLVGLMLAQNPALEYDDIYSILQNYSEQNLASPPVPVTCGGVGYDSYPNYHYGYGRINALRAVEAARTYKK